MKDCPVRKSIRLKDYDYSQNGACFITVCVKDRHEILGKTVGGDALIAPPFVELSEYGHVVLKYIDATNINYPDVQVDKYVIMPNHIHMIITLQNGAMWASLPTKTSVPTVVRSLKTLITKKIGFSLWQRSYHDHIIRNEAEYQKIWKYIDENPARWAEDEYCTERSERA